MADTPVRLDLRAVLAIAALAVVVLVIIFVELCGREDVEDLFARSTPVSLPTATIGPTFTPGPSPTIGPSPTPGPAQATAAQEAAAGAEGRDTTRVTDLAAIQEALEQYREEHGNYPDTSGNIQTLCAFVDFDAGCALDEVISPVPQDPLGDPVTNGYFYSSAGTEYILYAARESELFSECSEHPDHLGQLDSLLCVEGP